MSEQRTDHAAEAERLVRNWPAHMPNASTIAIAQVHATLALVEQQRIANLIELGFAEVHSTTTGKVIEPPEAVQQAWNALIDTPAPPYRLRPEIREALGI